MIKNIVYLLLIFNIFSFAAAFKDFEGLAVEPIENIPIPSSFNLQEKGSDRWFGADSRRTYLRFNSYVLYKIPSYYQGPASRILENSKCFSEINEIINLQLQHMYGAFTTHPGFENNPGIPSGDYKVTVLSAEKVPNENYAKINYSYDDIAVFSAKIFPSSGEVKINFVLPKDPLTIYSKGFPSPSSRKNRCTDEHYNSEGDFWYFWNPYQDGCPISGADLIGISANIKPLPMTASTYPEYDKLYGENGSGDSLKISYLVGIDESFKNGDLGKTTFLNSFSMLKESGFKVSTDEPRRKKLNGKYANKKVEIEMILLNPDSRQFALEAVNAMKTADIFLYDGHSGLGGYLNPDRLSQDSGERLSLPKNKYQIFVFQGCSTYAYYNGAFFNLKKSQSDPKGTKNLDIVTTGIGAAFEVGSAVDTAFINSVAKGERNSWQQIIRNMRKAEGDLSALTHVNGDEDNPKTP
ncbi:MAG: hypothetical protein GX447_04770 [Elusimicrobia bacterium]|nr:hypothetical protein [Elusimicrobiota bacterium]